MVPKEGFLLFYQQSIAKLFQAKIWVDASLEKHVCTYNYWIPLNMIPWSRRVFVPSEDVHAEAFQTGQGQAQEGQHF